MEKINKAKNKAVTPELDHENETAVTPELDANKLYKIEFTDSVYHKKGSISEVKGLRAELFIKKNIAKLV